jgi:cyclase
MKTLALATILAITMLAAWEAKAQTGQAATPSPYPVVQGKTYKFEKVADGVYYGTGGLGGNHPIIVNDNDVLLVDDGTTPATARALLEDMKLITDKPVRYVVNTHFHYDHTDGNQIFAPDVQIIAHQFVRTAIQSLNTPSILEREPFKTYEVTRVTQIESLKKQIADEKDAARKADLQKQLAAEQLLLEQIKEVKPTPPNVTYSSRMVLHKGPREIQFLFLGRGHTGGDTIVFLPKERIVCTGDMMETQPAYMGDAWFDEWITTLGALKELDFAVALPGHGHPFTDKGLITAFQSYLTDVTTQVATLRKQGLSPEDAAKRVDLTSHQKDFPQIQGPGAEIRGVRRIYEWMDQRGR